MASETVGTGIRLVLTGALSIAHHRLGSSIGRRYVFEAADPQEYTAVGVPRALQDGVRGVARAVDVNRGRLMQFALAPTSAEASSTEVVRAIGQRLSERWQEHTHLLPVALEELPWPLPIRHALASQPPSGVRQPVALSVDTELGDVSWLDAEEDGPTFVVTGPARSGRSTTLIAAATVMQRLGWQVAAVPLSRRSPLAEGGFPGEVLVPEDIKR